MLSTEQQLEHWPLERLIDYIRNPRKNEHAVDRVAAAIHEFGFRVPVVAKSDGTVVDGHLRLKAARKLKLATVPVLLADDLSEAQIKAFRLSVNRMAELAEWDEELLALELQELQDLDYDLDLTGFDEDELNRLLGLTEEEPVEGLTDPDEAPEVQAEAITQPGDVWLLGSKHRLLCGDSTRLDDVERLVGPGIQVDMLLTDPPYNVAYESLTKDKLTIKNDSMGDEAFRQFLRDAFVAADAVMKPGAVFYIWHSDAEGYNFRGACRDTGWKFRQALIWKKSSLVLGRQDYHYQHEPCIYGWKDGSGHLWASDRKQTTVLEFDKPLRNGEHPCLHPNALVVTARGFCEIGDVAVGDKVLASDGKMRGVTWTSRHPHMSDCLYEISVRGTNISTLATDNHPFLICRIKRNKSKNYLSHEVMWLPADQLRVGDYTMTPVVRQDEPLVDGLARIPDFWFVVGLYCAEGSTQKAGHGNNVYPRFSLHKKEQDLIDRVLSVASPGVSYGVYPNHGDGINLVVFDPVLGRLLLDICGSGASSKVLDEQVFSLDSSWRLALLHGYLAGDGGKVRDHWQAKTVSARLASQICVLAESVGYRANLHVHSAGGQIKDRKFKSTRSCYTIRLWDRGCSKSHTSTVEWNGVLFTTRYINRINKVPYSGDVVNLSVEGAESFQTAIGMSHNTMKPVALFEYQMLNNTKGGDLVLDTFGGSGTTVIAAERHGRQARVLELDPRYCDVIVRRFQNHTGQRAVLEATGEMFPEAPQPSSQS
jgi:site-specific DNA-methyltransferase (adenine-specific)